MHLTSTKGCLKGVYQAEPDQEVDSDADGDQNYLEPEPSLAFYSSDIVSVPCFVCLQASSYLSHGNRVLECLQASREGLGPGVNRDDPHLGDFAFPLVREINY
jgi:hypothetical protein